MAAMTPSAEAIACQVQPSARALLTCRASSSVIEGHAVGLSWQALMCHPKRHQQRQCGGP